MRLATRELSPQRGTVRLGHNVTLAYQDQQLARLDDDKTVLQEAMDATGLKAPEARDLLGAFLFSGDDVFKKVDRKSTRLNSSHANISYAVFCLKKKNTT